MKTLRPALLLTLFFVVLTGLAFPAFITLVSQTAFPYQANGSMLLVDGKTVGSALIGQMFTEETFFHPRPSSGGYDANNSGGTNLGPLNPKLLEGADGFDGVKQLAENYRAINGLGDDVVLPVDAVTRSASGLDPHISVENARLQASRVAKINGLTRKQVDELILRATERSFVGVFGEDSVNVLRLNLSVAELLQN